MTSTPGLAPFSAPDFRAIFEAAPGVLLVVAADTPRFTMVAASDARLAATLTNREDTLGRPLFAVFADANPQNEEPSGVANLRASFETVLSTRAPHRMGVQRYDLQRPDGAWEVRYWAPENVPVLAADGAVRYIIHHVQDVTDLALEREATAAAQRREAELRAVLESMSDGVHIGTADGISLANQTALRQLGYASAEVLNRRSETVASDVLMRDAATGASIPRDRLPFTLALAGERVTHDVLVRHRLTNEDRVMRCVAAPVVVNGAAVAAVAVYTDVTDQARDRRDLETALSDSEHARADAEAANRAKGEFLAVMSHELRTPLNAIGGYAQLIEMGIHGPVSESQHEALDRIQRSQRHLLALISGVLDYSRLEAGKVAYHVTDVRVVEVVAEAEALVAPQIHAKGLGYTWSVTTPGLAVRADREKLQQILLNLLSNAVKFTHGRNGSPGRIEVFCALGDGRVQISVRDTGDGIAAEELERVFEPFVQVDQALTREHQGVGLGLAISRDLARGMGGELVAESARGVGTTLTLTLPAATAYAV